jgi:hypothetical protein
MCHCSWTCSEVSMHVPTIFVVSHCSLTSNMISFCYHHFYSLVIWTFCINPLVLILGYIDFGIILCDVSHNTPIHHKWIAFTINQMNNLVSSNRVNTFCGQARAFKQYVHECKLRSILKWLSMQYCHYLYHELPIQKP